MSKILNITKFMNKVAPFYDQICTPCSTSRISYLKKIIVERNITNFIDLSCSTGQTLSLLKNCSCNFYGIDLSKKMILIAKEKVKNFNNYRFHKADMIRFLKHCKTTFDCIYSNSINWLPNLSTFVQLLNLSSKKINKNGIFIIDIPINGTPITNTPIYSHYSSKDKVITKTSIMYKSEKEPNSESSVKVLQMYSCFEKKFSKIFIGEFSMLNFTEKMFKAIIETSPFSIVETTIEYGTRNDKSLYRQYILKKKC